ncbi:MAG: SH3 domain-containing protein [Chloroflexi bacterium]|nr:SH3 domain-containing protein [Chloroflexota bacterium]
MSKRTKHVLPAILVVVLAVIACNLPSETQQPGLSSDDIANTAVAKALTAQASGASPLPPDSTATALPPTAIPSATQCNPMVTANTDANVRGGPGTAYDVIGYLPAGAAAPVAGKNDANTWWYIQFAGGYGGYAWVAGSVTTATCIPPVLQVVAAPPLPTAVPPTAVPPAVAKPDLIVSEYSWNPDPPHMGVTFHIRIGAYNQGNGPAGAFDVQWWLSTTAPAPACTWHLDSMVAHGGRILQCDYTPGGWANYPSQVIVDSGNDVHESNEGNNTSNQTIGIKP